jgi:hypothetical protein
MYPKIFEIALKSAPVQAAGKQAVEKTVAWAGAAVGTAGIGVAAKKRLKLQHKKKAVRLARQTHGQYSEKTIVGGEERYVVWKDGVPMYAFPELNHDQGPLEERPELRDFPQSLLKDPRR